VRPLFFCLIQTRRNKTRQVFYLPDWKCHLNFVCATNWTRLRAIISIFYNVYLLNWRLFITAITYIYYLIVRRIYYSFCYCSATLLHVALVIHLLIIKKILLVFLLFMSFANTLNES